MPPRLVHAKQVAELLNVSRSTVYKWVHEGRIPHYKIGKAVRFKEDEVWDWVKKHRARGAGHPVGAHRYFAPRTAGAVR